MLTVEELKQLLDYDQNTGVFTWKVRRSGTAVIGSIAGHLKKSGYIYISINYKQYTAHRLAFLYVNGVWPTNDIDHINGIKIDNRIVNLRDVTSRENQSNFHTHRNGKLVGASYHKLFKKWLATIEINGERIYLGNFPTEEAAHQAYLTALATRT
jgi:hypothetical protein